MSKLILNHPDIVQIVAETLFDHNAVDHFTSCPTEWPDGTASDVIYVSDAEKYKPVLIEVQRNVDQEFLLRLISYSVCAQRKYKKPPVILVFVISTINPAIRDQMVTNQEKAFLMDFPCDVWAHSCHFVDATSIADKLSVPLHPFLALSSFLIDEQPSLLTHTSQPDPTIRKLYTLAKRMFDDYLVKEDTLFHRCTRIIDNTETKITNALTSLRQDVPTIRQRKRTEKALEEGLHLICSFKRQCRAAEDDTENESDTVPPPTTATSAISLPSSSTNDNEFVQSWLDTNEWVHIPWQTIYQEGKEMGQFKSINSWKSVKSGYYRWSKRR
ncbi:hypothetical protein BDA99DRAFT_571288 [Phascolomyces articulosus]|uniref:Uncharacterized protein n=1 Tax=Phascolomyces articulosus TaxID=60185 RepID=A0AAD5KAZ5_9FUNG|nr:hypothetical protein BDA99DRAFT_571288 [Phascolomyces articulosus]